MADALKKAVIDHILENEGFVRVVADGSKCVLPQGFEGKNVLLEYGYFLPIPIPDLTVDNAGIHATLSFSRTATKTFVPFSAVKQVASFHGMNVIFVQHGEENDKPSTPAPPAKPSSRPALRLVK